MKGLFSSLLLAATANAFAPALFQRRNLAARRPHVLFEKEKVVDTEAEEMIVEAEAEEMIVQNTVAQEKFFQETKSLAEAFSFSLPTVDEKQLADDEMHMKTAIQYAEAAYV
jgi:hypothetical protein